MRNNLRPLDKALRLVSSVEPLADSLANTEFLKDRPRPAQIDQQNPHKVGEGPRWMPASGMALAGGISLVVWALIAWTIGTLTE
jgi:hypothetical protein